jgi:hypothetical protein
MEIMRLEIYNVIKKMCERKRRSDRHVFDRL